MDGVTVQRLEEFRESKRFYDALQFCRTKITRGFRLKNGNESVIPLTDHAFGYFLSERQYQCAIDVITLYVESLSKNKMPLTSDTFELISDILKKLFVTLQKEEGNLSSESQKLIDSACCKLVDLVIQWTKQQTSSDQEKKYGSFRLHGILAEAFLASHQLDRAKIHFLLSDDADGVVSFVRTVLKNRQDISEIILITENVLQVLCLDRFSYAVSIFDRFVSDQKYPFETPLLNFMHILFNVIRSENVAQFVELTDAYQIDLKRSLSVIGYLETIGHLYFGINSGPMDAGFGSLFAGLLGKPAEQKRATSHKTIESNGQTAPRAPGSFMPMLNLRDAKKKDNLPVDDDLD